MPRPHSHNKIAIIAKINPDIYPYLKEQIMDIIAKIIDKI